MYHFSFEFLFQGSIDKTEFCIIVMPRSLNHCFLSEPEKKCFSYFLFHILSMIIHTFLSVEVN